MTLPASGQITMAQVSVELGRASTANTSLGESAVRTLAGIASGQISLNDLHGKSSYTPMTVTPHNALTGTYDTSINGGTASASPYVSVTGGSGGYTYVWTITAQSGSSPSFTNSTTYQPTLSRTYTKLSNGFFSVTLQCVVTDNTSHSVTVTGITAYSDWGSA